MKYKVFRFLKSVFLLVPLCLFPHNFEEKASVDYIDTTNGTYSLIITGYDWGPSVNQVILDMEQLVSNANISDFTVTATRSAEGVEMQPAEQTGERKVLLAYVSDEKGNRLQEGNHVTLTLLVGPDEVLSAPIKYVFKEGRGANQWIDYKLKIVDKTRNQTWDTEKNRIQPLVDRFDLSGTYSHEDGTNLTYASYEPIDVKGKLPLIIWLHGGGEGGTDTSIPLVANKATNYASDEIQQLFGKAQVLVPQSPTFWMQSTSGEYTRGEVNDIYNEALMGLIRKYVTEHPNVDEKRIYIGGCSNGGYMSLKLLLLHPDYFAAAYISALAYHTEYITDKQLNSIKDIPIWFVHCKDDPVTLPEKTVVPFYKRLIAAGAENVHFSYYDHATDLTGFFGGEAYRYNGHFSWIYSHANHADFDFDGSPVQMNGSNVTIMEWMAAQHR